MLRPKHILLILVMILLVATPLVAQDKERIKRLTPTHKGSTGLYNLFTADTLRQGEFSISAVAHKFNRDPGRIDYTVFPVTLTIGLHDRIELFGSFEAYKRVNADNIMVNKLLPRDPVMPARLANGQIGFYQESPFMDTGFGDGAGDLWAGIKFSILSEHYGDGVSLAVQPIFKFHMTDERQHLLRGLTSGATDGGVDAIISKQIAGGGIFTANLGFMWAGDKYDVEREDKIVWGAGVEVPLGTQKVSLIGEVMGNSFYTDSYNSDLVNEESPIDAYAGLRIYPARWATISAAASYHMTGTADRTGLEDSECLGFYTQLAVHRKINRPPTATCSADSTTVTEGDSARISVDAYDEDDNSLGITWKSSGGRLAQQESSATLDTTGLAPGRYSVMAEVTDGDNVASCSTDITVEKRKMPPTISCGSGVASVQEGQSTNLAVQASDPNGDALTYSWTIDGQSVTNNATSFAFGTAGRAVGKHTVRVTATDVDNMSASCEFAVTITARPNSNPTCSVDVSSAQAYAGETVTATAKASDPENDPLTYSWKVDGQSRSGSATELQINTAGMAGGSHSVTVDVKDDRGGSCSATKSFAVVEKSTLQVDRRVDNKAKAALDEIALKMQQNPQLRAKLTGHTDDRGSEEANMKAGLKRAELVKEYLVKQHNIDGNRIETASAGESSPIADNSTDEGRKQNKRVDIELFVR
ncbi:MAG: OmpA family protein [Acidobacteriota bacterium]|nr:MAG: OmpA family protein [Acidobacteriota bacterium]